MTNVDQQHGSGWKFAMQTSVAHCRGRWLGSAHLAIVVDPQRVQPQLGPPGDDLEDAQLRTAGAKHVLLNCTTGILLDCCSPPLAGACTVPQRSTQADL